MFLSSPDHIDSYYAASCPEARQSRPALADELEVDVVIVGAGYTGLYTALNLAEAGLSVAILEASRVGWGASGRNGGQIILGFSCDMAPFEATLGLGGARRVWGLIQDAAGEIRRRIADHGIACDLAEGHLWTSVQQRRVKLLTDWQEEAAKKWGYRSLHFIPKSEIPRHIGSDRYQAALLDSSGGHLHPLKYVHGLARAAEGRGVRIFEQTKACRYSETAEGVVVETERGRVRAGKLVLACNAYIDRLDSRLQRKVLPVGTYMIATEPLDESLASSLLPSGHAVSDNQFILDYFRLSADRRLLFGGKCTYTGRTPSRLAEGMRQDMLKVFPQLREARISHAWGGHIDITVPRTPDFGRAGNVYWAQGFSGHGLVPTCVAGRVLAEAIRGDQAHLDLFMALRNPDIPGGERLGGLLQVVGMSYYRLRDYF
ncbi:FAD-binding oxidoreductase [Chitinimonas arctica]|uniref:FAD-binding oxidoreductase n=1 Tax=Chitinimonas arctica TaxID=2594795 RepID=A0A516SDE1_9NEIS|nr:FAD-binding oxidoreductase [Chitinimonas arctica]QDQ26172.1 FAD-binding oxidoreductase [Chitinimonas arctica]